MIVERSCQGELELPRVHAYTTFFYSKLIDGGHNNVERWTKKVDIFDSAIVLVPVHKKGPPKHWSLAVIDMQRKAIVYYDSMGGRNIACLKALSEYVKNEHLAKKGVRRNKIVNQYQS